MKTTTEKAIYTLKFAANDQDNLNIIDFKLGDDFPKFLDYDAVLEFSIKPRWQTLSVALNLRLIKRQTKIGNELIYYYGK